MQHDPPPVDPPYPVDGSMTSTTTVVRFDRPIVLVSSSIAAWQVMIVDTQLLLTGVAKLGTDQVQLTHWAAQHAPRTVAMLNQVVAGDPDGELAELFGDFPVS